MSVPYTMETACLADFVSAQAGELLGELGAGSAEASSQVLARIPGVTVHALELQPALVKLARAGLAPFGARARVFSCDIRHLPAEVKPGSYDHVFSNPPYFPSDGGRIPPDPLRAAARFELNGDFSDFCHAACHLLRVGGLFHVVHLPDRLPHLLDRLRASGLNPFLLLPVHDRLASPAVAVLIRARKGGREALTILPPKVLKAD